MANKFPYTPAAFSELLEEAPQTGPYDKAIFKESARRMGRRGGGFREGNPRTQIQETDDPKLAARRKSVREAVRRYRANLKRE